MPTFGNNDIVQDKNGNVLPNVVIEVYASQANATSRTGVLASPSTNASGQWPVTINGYDQVWARDPQGNIWVVASDTVAGDHAARLAALESAGYAPASGSGVYETQSHAAATYAPATGSSTYETQSHAASTYETQAHAASTYAPATGSGVYETQTAADLKIYYVTASASASDSNTGRSWGKAFATIGAAVTALGGNPGEIHVGPGVFTISSSIMVGNDFALHGSGRGATVIRGNFGGALIRPINRAVRYYRWLLSDFGLDNTSSGTAGGIGLDMTNVSHSRIDNLDLTNVETGLVLTEAAYYNEFSTVEVSGAVTAAQIGGGASSTNECLFNNLRINSVTNGVVLNNSTNMTFVKPSVESFTGIAFDIAPTSATQYVNLITPRFENVGGVGVGVRNRALAQATTWLGGASIGQANDFINDAASKELLILRPGVGTTFVSVLLDAPSNNGSRIYASGGTTYNRNPADTAYNDFDTGTLTVRRALGHAGTTVGFYGHTPVTQPAAPVTLADVIAVLRGCGLTA